jgi:hypothetical protein
MGLALNRLDAQLEKSIRQWNPEAIWKVTVWNREKYLIAEVQAGSEDLAKSFAIHALCRDGETENHLTVTECIRVE